MPYSPHLAEVYIFSFLAAGERFVIVDVPLLYETKSTLYLTREVIVVSWFV